MRHNSARARRASFSSPLGEFAPERTTLQRVVAKTRPSASAFTATHDGLMRLFRQAQTGHLEEKPGAASMLGKRFRNFAAQFL